MSDVSQRDPLEPALDKVQAELVRHLDEACEAEVDDVRQGSLDELLHLEEELLAAARAADEAVRLRRRLGERESGDGGAPGPQPADRVAPAPEEARGRVREFRDRQGRAWRVWEVRPGVDRPLRDMHRYLGAYVHGWLAFGWLDNELRKRLPKYPPDWLQMSDPELEALLNGAVDVPPRKTAPKPEVR